MSDVEVRKTYHENGAPFAEIELVAGRKHGRVRLWHENGQLMFEGFFKNDVPDGVGIFWDDKGREFDRYEVKDGTGVERFWNQDLTRMTETPWVGGVTHGVIRRLDRRGKVTSENYCLHGREVMYAEEYLEACGKDPSLRRPTPAGSSDWSPLIKAAISGDYDAYGREILNQGGAYEARAWLAEGAAQGLERTAGEETDALATQKILEKFYKAGAKTVWVYEVDEETQNSGRLLVELPEAAKERAAVLRVCNKWNTQFGFDRDKDRGQHYVAVMLD